MDLVTFGEAMMRLSPPRHQRLEQAQGFDAHVGGAELNVAVAASRLGVASRWVSRLPDNALGRMIANRARALGVEARVEWTAGDRVGLYFIEQGTAPRQTGGGVLYDRAASAFSKIAPGTTDWSSVLRGARWFHTSGITPALSESAAAVAAEALRSARAAGVTTSYDVNYRGRLWSPERARMVQEPLFEYVDVLVTTEDDARTVFGASDSSPEVIARTLRDRFGVSAVAITLRESDDGRGALLAANGSVHSAPRHDVEVVDRVGAGDAFIAGLIVSRLDGGEWREAVRFATALAAIKLTMPGDFCLATRDAVERMLRAEPARLSR